MTSAEIIAVGSELLKPEKIDTNSLWFTEKLNEIGIQVKVKIIVGDEIETIKQVVQQSLGRSELIILTGGLGPTQDDVTREAVARAINRELIYSPEIAESIRQKFAMMNRPMLETNKRQAYIIDGARVLHNESGQL
jgi:nicotinamide-nucleotide amidase